MASKKLGGEITLVRTVDVASEQGYLLSDEFLSSSSTNEGSQEIEDADNSGEEIVEISEPTEEIESIHTEDLDLDLNQPIKAKISTPEDIWILENDELGIVASGKDHKEALKDFREYFQLLYKVYYQEEDEKLGDGAKKLKDKIKNLVE